MYRSFSVRRNRQSKPERPPGLIACQSATRYSRKHNKKGASPLPLRLTEVRPSTRMYRNRTWEHTPNGVYPQHLFPDIHLIGRFQLRANSSKYHFKTKIAKSAGFPKKRGAERQKSFSRGSSGAPQAALTEAGGGRCEGAVRGDAGRSAAAREGHGRGTGGARGRYAAAREGHGRRRCRVRGKERGRECGGATGARAGARAGMRECGRGCGGATGAEECGGAGGAREAQMQSTGEGARAGMREAARDAGGWDARVQARGAGSEEHRRRRWCVGARRRRVPGAGSEERCRGGESPGAHRRGREAAKKGGGAGASAERGRRRSGGVGGARAQT